MASLFSWIKCEKCRYSRYASVAAIEAGTDHCPVCNPLDARDRMTRNEFLTRKRMETKARNRRTYTKKWCMKCRTRHLLTTPHDENPWRGA